MGLQAHALPAHHGQAGRTVRKRAQQAAHAVMVMRCPDHVSGCAAGGAGAQATAVAIASAFVTGGATAQAVAKACAVAIANYGCPAISSALARE